jgi:hypothetical protein
MRRLDARGIAESSATQEASRLRIAQLEARRRAVVAQIAATLKLEGSPSLAAVASAMPQMKPRLLDLRDQLRSLMQRVSSRVTIAGRLCGAILGHLNTVVRLIAGAVEQAGLYTRSGVPRVSRRIGVMEAVG